MGRNNLFFAYCALNFIFHRYLNLRGCYRISRDLLLKVCSDDLIKLKELDVRKCADEISKSVEFLKHDRLKHIKIIYLV